MLAVVHGFTPFGEFDPNPSQELIADLARRPDSEGRQRAWRPAVSPPASSTPESPFELITEVLSVSFEAVTEQVPRLIEEHRPDLWIGAGLAAGRPALSLEAVALNLAGWTDPDNDGLVLERGPACDGGPVGYLSTLPVETILEAWKDAGIPGYLSQTAGSYLCNLSFYLAAHTVARLGIPCLVGFLHLPLLPEQVTDPARQPSMSRELQRAGLDAVIEASRMSDAASEIYLRRTA